MLPEETLRALKEYELLFPHATFTRCADEARCRRILIGWLWEIVASYELSDDAMCCAVQIIDRYLGGNTIARNKLQLLGYVALVLGSKLHDVTSLKYEEVAYLTENTYTKAEAIALEAQVLKALDFFVTWPLITQFVDTAKDPELRFLFEMCTYSENMIGYLPSTIAETICAYASDDDEAPPPHLACHIDLRHEVDAVCRRKNVSEIRRRHPGMF